MEVACKQTVADLGNVYESEGRGVVVVYITRLYIVGGERSDCKIRLE
jgi:hypothetical protein